MTQITVGTEDVKEMFIGEMGIKEVIYGETNIYTRTGGFFYLELSTKEESN